MSPPDRSDAEKPSGLHRLGTTLAGGLVGLLVGGYVTVAVVVLKARFGHYIFGMEELTEFRPESVPLIVGLIGGSVLGFRDPVPFARALLRGMGALLVGAVVGMGVGRLVWGPDEGMWAGAIVSAAFALVATIGIALRRAHRRKLRVPDMAASGFVLAGVAVAFLIGIRPLATTEMPSFDPTPLPHPSDVDQVIFIVGDAGATEAGVTPLLRALKTDVENWSATLARTASVAVVYPGDLVYPVGVRNRDHPAFATDSTRLWNQIDLVSGPAARQFGSMGLFQTGNHDWGNTDGDVGFERVANLEEQLAHARRGGIDVSLLPDAGSPGPAVRDLRDNVRWVFMDTHWFLRGRDHSGREQFFDELREAINSAGDRHVILSAHHPYQSAGPHGAIVPGVQAWGIEYLLRRSGAIVQDLNSPAYGSLLSELRRTFEQAARPPLAYVGGHDHSLQVLAPSHPSDPAFTLVSGSGSKVSAIRTLPNMLYGAGQPGYMKLILTKDGGVDLFVVAGETALLRCQKAAASPSSCMTQGENSFDIVYGQNLAEAPDRPATPAVLAVESDDTESSANVDGEVTNANDPGAAEPIVPRAFPWWTRTRLPAEASIAEADFDIAVPPPAVPARVLYFNPDSVVTTTGASYSASVMQKIVLGDLNRHLWDVPIRLPVLNLDSLGGGVEATELTGGRQTIGIMLEGADGREYQFRSVVKDASRALSEPFQDTPVDAVMQDQLAAQFPAAAPIVTEFLEAVGVLVAPTRLVVLPQHSRLGEYRPYFAGRVGWIELKPNEREDNRPGFAESRKIVGGDEFYEELAEDPTAYADHELYLRARFVDFLVGDWDRHSDNLRWARFEEDGRSRWEPIPKDRDWAFARTGGLGAQLSGTFMPRFVGFGEQIPPADRLASAAFRIDRRVLGGVDRSLFLEQARLVATTITPEVIERALATLPPEYHRIERDRLSRALRARLGQLPRAAGEFFDALEVEVHIYGFEGRADTVSFQTRDDGQVVIRVRTEGVPEDSWVERTVDPSRTSQVVLVLEPEQDSVDGTSTLPFSVTVVDPDERPEDEGGGKR